MIINADLAAKRCMNVAVFTSAVLTSGFWGQWDTIMLAWLGCYPLAVLYGFLFANFMSIVFGAEFVDEAELQEMAQAQEESMAAAYDENGSSVSFHEYEDDEGTIFSEEIVGRYMDKTIHEWVMVNDPDNADEKIKCEYFNCVEFGKDFALPGDAEYFVLLEPGILYVKRHDPEPECDEHEDQEEA